MKVTQHLWFETDMEAAMRFYTGLIPGSAIHWTSAVAADNPGGRRPRRSRPSQGAGNRSPTISSLLAHRRLAFSGSTA
jgi:hypothetical protein